MKWMQANHAYSVHTLLCCVCVCCKSNNQINLNKARQESAPLYDELTKLANLEWISPGRNCNLAWFPWLALFLPSISPTALVNAPSSLLPRPFCSSVSWNWEFIVMRLSAQLGCMQHGNEPRQQKIKIDARMLSAKYVRVCMYVCAHACVCVR